MSQSCEKKESLLHTMQQFISKGLEEVELAIQENISSEDSVESDYALSFESLTNVKKILVGFEDFLHTIDKVLDDACPYLLEIWERGHARNHFIALGSANTLSDEIGKHTKFDAGSALSMLLYIAVQEKMGTRS